MSSWYRKIAISQHPLARLARWLNRQKNEVSLAVPMWLAKPLVWVFLGLRSAYYTMKRIFVAEPFFRTYCRRVGRNFHTGAHLHWVMGRGIIDIGDNVLIDGRCNFFFAARYSEAPTLTIGDHSGIGHSCSFTVGKAIRIGNHVRIAANIAMFDTPGHPMQAEARKAGLPAAIEDVKPITIGDNVWIGSNATIFPGVTIGDNSVVAFGALVMSDVPPNVVVAGNPARQIAKIPLA